MSTQPSPQRAPAPQSQAPTQTHAPDAPRTGTLRAKARRFFQRALIGGLLAMALVTVWVLAVPFPAELLAPDTVTSAQILDRDGRLLREVLQNPQKGRARWVPASQISPHLIQATIHTEDKRFENHKGVDPLAILRAVWLNVSGGRVISGASTLTQQTVKMVMPQMRRRTLATKAREAVWAVRLEQALSKPQIMEQYLNRAPYGNQLFGVEAAARAYFGKSASELSLAQSTLLAAIPQAPGVTEPRRHKRRAVARQRFLLGVMRGRGAITEDAYRQALTEPIEIRRHTSEVLAMHFTDEVLRRLKTQHSPLPAQINTTLDLELQTRVEGIINAQLERLEDRQVGQAAVLVLDNTSGDVLAWAGSRGYWSKRRLGSNDGVLALRQPGSTLKPFVYGLYLERGGTAADMLDDLPTQFPTDTGVYIPKNYDQRHRGPVSLRQSLASSLNIPAVAATAVVEPRRVLERLHKAGMKSLELDAEHYGLGISLGNGEVTMLELAGAYASLGRMGRWRPARLIDAIDGQRVRDDAHQMETVFSPEVTYQLLDMLSDDAARDKGFGRDGPLALPYRVAAKTGTSTNFRDNWAVGVTPGFTVAVWAGNFDGTPMQHVSGVTGAAPIMRQVFQALYPKAAGPQDVAWFTQPRNLHKHTVCALSGHPAGPHCPTTSQELFMDGRRGASGPAQDGGHRVAGPHTCQVHVAHTIDTRTGGVAGPGCDPAFTQQALFHRLPHRWLEWGMNQGLQLEPQHWSPLCPGEGPVSSRSAPSTSNVQLVHPLPGDQFFIDADAPKAHQKITLRAQWPGAAPSQSLTWFINGQPLRTVQAPYTTAWTPEPGHHTIGVGQDAPEAQIHITVQ